jgi:hypothetical protein
MNSCPQEIQDAINALILAYKDLKANKGASLIQDELPLILKLAGELSALKADLNAKGLEDAAIYLLENISSI